MEHIHFKNFSLIVYTQTYLIKSLTEYKNE